MQSNVDELIGGVKEGDMLADKYRVDRVLGVGGMGVVVQATHTVLNDRVALKFLLPELLENDATVARFMREAHAMVRIKSPHVARVTDVGKLENGAPYMVMEFLEGKDLGRVLEDGPLDVQTAITYVLQACEAVAAAHANGVIHRDIKPANIFLTQGPDQRPVLKVLDFGISKVANRDGVGSLTQTFTAMGSPLYMSPEQMRSAKSVDARTDVWSLGIVLYEMLTGTLPFVADTMPQLCALILETEPPSLKEAVPDLPEGLDEAVRKAIDRNVEGRYQDIAELALAIGPFAGPTGIESARRAARILQAAGLGSDSGDGPMSVMPRPAPVASTSTAFTGSAPVPQEGAQRKWLLALAAGGIALISLSAAWAIYRISTPDPVPTAVAPDRESHEAAITAAPPISASSAAPLIVAAPSATVSAEPPAETPPSPPPIRHPSPPKQTVEKPKPKPVNLDDRE